MEGLTSILVVIDVAYVLTLLAGFLFFFPVEEGELNSMKIMAKKKKNFF